MGLGLPGSYASDELSVIYAHVPCFEGHWGPDRTRVPGVSTSHRCQHRALRAPLRYINSGSYELLSKMLLSL